MATGLAAGTRGMRRFNYLALGVLVLAGAACGGGGKSTGVQGSPAPTSAAPSPSASMTALQTYCDRVYQTENVTQPSVPTGATPEQIKQADQSYAQKILPLVTEAEQNAPAEIHADVTLILDKVKVGADSGDLSALSSADVQGAFKRTHTYEVANCGWQVVNAVAVEYAFQGIPATLSPGRVDIELSNQGKESHDLVLVRHNAGVTETTADLLKLPKAEYSKKLTAVGRTFTRAGENSYLLTSVEPGNYAVVCFTVLPDGSGLPQHTKGMFNDIVVK
jgi:hypothetical protein